jgi:hypothetical protein
MTCLRAVIVAVGLAMPVSALGASAWDGTWKADMSSATFSGKPIVILVKNGVYHCKSCVPPDKIKADGKPHATPGSPYHDMGTATLASPNEVDLTYTKGGKTVLTQVISVSDDGMTATFKGSDSTATNAAPVDFNYAAKREGKVPKGAAPVSGNWMATGGTSSDNGITISYKTTGDTLSMTTPTGQSYSAKFGGPQVPYVGDPGTTTVAVKKLNDHTIEETDYRDAKVSAIYKTTVSADGKTAKVVMDFPMSGQHQEFTANKM